ncbi:hypothetical protein LINGRAHAP2_LOCUS22331 [Linum grandiflorum]
MATAAAASAVEGARFALSSPLGDGGVEGRSPPSVMKDKDGKTLVGARLRRGGADDELRVRTESRLISKLAKDKLPFFNLQSQSNFVIFVNFYFLSLKILVSISVNFSLVLISLVSALDG